MAKSERRLLAREAGVAGRGQVAPQRLELGQLASFRERAFELVLAVEVILNRALIAARNEYEVLNAGLARLIHDVLKDRPIDHGQKFFRHNLGRRQEPGPKAGDREHSLANGLSRVHHACYLSGWGRT